MRLRHVCAAAVVLLAAPAPGQEIRQLTLPTKDLVYSSLTGKIYASVPGSVPEIGNSITEIDPATGTVGPSVFIGSGPGKLALSDDGRTLYVALDGANAIRRYDVTTRTPGLQFPYPPGTFILGLPVVDMEVPPGQPHSVVVTRERPGGFALNAVLFENGVPRPETASQRVNLRGIEFGASASQLYGYSGSGFGGGFSEPGLARLSVDASGVALLDLAQHPIPGEPADIRYAGGRIYTTSGYVLDPEAGLLLGVLAVPGAHHLGLLAPDLDAGRVFYLALNPQISGQTLVAFDTRNLLPVGSMEIPSATGSVSSLIRWGEEGLAFRTGEDQLFLLRTPLARASRPAADLTLSLFHGPDPSVAGEELTYSAIVANQGPDAATDVAVRLELPSGAHFVSASASQGKSAHEGDRLIADLGLLAAGASATVRVTVRPTAPGRIESAARVTAREDDAIPANNEVTDATVVQVTGGPHCIWQVRLRAGDLVYDRFRGKIYASVPGSVPGIGNSIATLDPRTGAIGPFLFVGGGPGQMALSDNGQYLYVYLEDVRRVRRWDLHARTLSEPFSLGEHPFRGPRAAFDLAAVPGEPEAVAVAMTGDLDPQVAVFDNGAQRPNVVSGGPRIAFGGSASRLYSAAEGLVRVAVDAAGVSFVDISSSLPSLGDIEYAGGRLYDTSGRIIDPEAPALLGTFAVDPAVNAVEPDAANRRVFFLAGREAGRRLQIFDADTLLPTGALTVADVSGPGASLIRWGEDGLAFRTDDDPFQEEGGQIFILRTPLVRGAVPSADLSVTLSDAPDPATAGVPLSYTLTVTNHGPDAAPGAAILDTLPAGVTFYSVTTSQGSGGYADGTAFAQLGTLAPGASATVTIRVTPRAAGRLVNTTRSLAESADPNPANDTATEATEILPGPPIDLSLSKAASPDPVTVGGEVTYLLTVTHAGPGPADGVRITDTLPAGMEFVSATASQGNVTRAAGSVEIALGSLEAGIRATATIVVRATAVGSLTNTAQVRAAQPDPNPDNNTATARSTVLPPPGPDLAGEWIRLAERCLRMRTRLFCRLIGALRVRNAGTESAPRSTLRFYLSRDALLDPKDRLLAKHTVSSLRPGRITTLSLDADVPDGRSAKGQYVIAVLDAASRVAERDEQNNQVLFGPLH
jgi:uncharacterized repeat protein (TIGR01451 family)